MRVRDIMRKEVVTVTPEETIARAATLMREQGFRHLPVTRGRHVLGIVSDRDVAGKSDELVASVMSEPAVWVTPNDTLRRAANVMRTNKFGCVPVVEDDKLVGILTETDALEKLSRSPSNRRERPSMRIKGQKRKRPPRPKGD